MRRSGAAGLGPRPRGRRGRRGGGYCTFPPGPARSVPTRATERACAASCRAASTPDPAAAASSATEPVVTQAQNTALKGGGSGSSGGSAAAALRYFRFLAPRPPTSQGSAGPRRAPLPAEWGALPQCSLVAGGTNRARDRDSSGGGPVKSRKRQRLARNGRTHCGAPLLNLFYFFIYLLFHSTNIY